MIQPTGGRLSTCLLGAPLDSGNLGVSALAMSALAGLGAREPDSRAIVFDNGQGMRRLPPHAALGGLDVEQRGMWLSLRLHRPESMWRMVASALVAPTTNANVQQLREADQVWDISGGDSFSDIYGGKRFVQVVLPKYLAASRSGNLFLLPQTYGPFRSRRTREAARRIVARSRAAWARDGDSHDRLRELLGADFDPQVHRQCADVAFTLPALRPPSSTLGVVADWVADAGGPVVGVNVSGLLSSPDANERFGLSIDHHDAMVTLVRRLLAETDCRVVLIPHVVGDSPESDLVACRRVAAVVDDPERIAMVAVDDPCHAKWVISHMDWVTGARMHATIAALSSCTPVTGIAYSDKIGGVFASCGIRDQVVDARSSSQGDLADALWQGWQQRDATRATLESRVPATARSVEDMFDRLVGSRS